MYHCQQALFIYSNPRKSRKRAFPIIPPQACPPSPWWEAMAGDAAPPPLPGSCFSTPLHFPRWQTRTNRKAKSALLGLLGNALVKYTPDKMLLLLFSPRRISETSSCKVENRVSAIFSPSLLVLQSWMSSFYAFGHRGTAPILMRESLTLWHHKPLHCQPQETNPSLTPLMGELWSHLKWFVTTVTMQNLRGAWFLLVALEY